MRHVSKSHLGQTLLWFVAVAFLVGTMAGASGNDASRSAARTFDDAVRPVVGNYCLKCHSAEKHKGDIDLERFTSSAVVFKHPKPWQLALEQLTNGEMPPQDKPQPTPEERKRLVDGINSILDEVAAARDGDPGPVVLRRLNNAEYTYTVRDLTGVESLDPAKEFPADSASGEGFMNVGNSLVMSPSLLTKYFDAAKEIARHAVLLPDGIGFSPSTSQRDWTEEKLTAIRAFYNRFTENGGGTAVNLQGIKFDTKDGGVLPFEKYFAATLTEREALKAGKKSITEVAHERGLNAKYLGTLWTSLNDTNSSLLLDQVRAQWRMAKPDALEPLMMTLRQWQQGLWRFSTVGHIGKRDGPKAWQTPVTPLAEVSEVKLKLQAPAQGNEATLYLVASDAGDGNTHDVAVWENPRLTAPGRADLPLRDLRASVNGLEVFRQKAFSNAAECLSTAAELNGPLSQQTLAKLSKQHGMEPAVLAAWLECLGLGGEANIERHLTQKLESAVGYDFIKGWVGADALSVLANSSGQAVRVPGNMKPHGVAVHPSPKFRVVVGWRSPVATRVRVEGMIQHVHTECGNGVTWALELRRGSSRQRLAAGFAQGPEQLKLGPFENLSIRPGELLCVSVGPRDGNHSCDLTAVDLTVTDETHQWDLAGDVSPDILAGNPHADRLGNPGVWHFYSEPDTEDPGTVFPAGSLLTRWQTSDQPVERQRIANDLQMLLTGGGPGIAKDSPDGILYRQLTSLNGPLIGFILRKSPVQEAFLAAQRDQKHANSAGNEWGLDPSLFGKNPNGDPIAGTSLCVQAPSVITVRLPAELVDGCEFAATATLSKDAGAEGSVQMQVLKTLPTSTGLTLAAAKEQGPKATWSDGERPVVSDAPILIRKGSATEKRLESAFEDFRQLFPAALCYTKIVPVDEVVTLTLYYREDEFLQRLMLDDAQTAELNRLWAELHFISQDALKLVDGFEQLWQFATQDADPSAFEPLREPIKRKAEAFKKLLVDTQPAHLQSALNFAESACRRPLTEAEKNALRGLYKKLRAEEMKHDEAIRLVLARTLVTPAFLYRAEQAPAGNHAEPLNDWELATRLSYFLWSSAPDHELFAAAAASQLRDPAVLAAQTRRMLRDPRSRRLATEFACSWLQIHDFDSLDEKNERYFPTFAALKAPMYEEAIRFFADLFQQDETVLSIIDADYTFLNDALAKHYGIPGVTGSEWRRVDGVKQYGRGGILGFGAILAKQSGASRTSPILRGNWVAEVLLGDRLPRPPKDVPKLPEVEAGDKLSVRQLVEQHSNDPRCSVCHVHIDGYGFALEGYDAIGRSRTHDLAGHPIETRAKVFDGSMVEDAPALRVYLLSKKRATVLGQFNRKLLGYALGRGVMLSDRPLLAEMQRQLEASRFAVDASIEAIVRSRQFREIRGKEMAADD
jgi:hypothetical protein